MLTVLEVLQRTTDFFKEKGVPDARLDAELLLARVLELRRLDLYLQFERPLEEETLAALRPLVRRRAGREPLQYILGDTEFRGLRLKVDSRALIPRSETEELVDAILARFADAPPQRVLDLGTGSGAIALALASEWPEAQIVATDAAPEPLELARENAEALGLAERVDLRQSNWLDSLSGRFDLIVSNPPYLTRAEMESSEPEVRNFEPVSALVAEDEGVADLAAILAAAPRHLEPGGLLALETGIAQGERLSALAAEHGLCAPEVLPDLSGRPRFFLARQPD